LIGVQAALALFAQGTELIDRGHLGVDQSEVLESGGLAFSSGPVLDPDGNEIGRFNSIWREDPDGVWRVVFDRGS